MQQKFKTSHLSEVIFFVKYGIQEVEETVTYILEREDLDKDVLAEIEHVLVKIVNIEELLPPDM